VFDMMLSSLVEISWCQSLGLTLESVNKSGLEKPGLGDFA